MRSSKGATTLRLSAQLAPVTLLLGTFLVVPLGVFLLYSVWQTRSFTVVADWTFTNYSTAFQGEYLSLIRNTLVIAAATAVAATTIAYVFAHAVRFHLRRWQEPLLLLVMVALFSGYLVRIYAWRTILGDSGMVNKALASLGVTDEPVTFLLYNRFAAILVLTNFLVPLAVLPIYAALQNVRDEEVEAGRDLGGTAFRATVHIVLPLAWRGIFFAFALTFVIAAGDYVTPEYVGGTSGQMVGRTIADTFLTAFDWPLGSALAVVTLASIVLILVVCRRVSEWALR